MQHQTVLYTPTMIIGAGPAGLAAAFYLQQAKRPFLILERESVGYAWQNHYDSLRLHTLKEVSALPGLPMPFDYPPFPDRAQLLAYFQSYAAHFAFPIITNAEVIQAIRQEGRWHIQTHNSRFQTDSLILATGIWSRPWQPNLPGEETFPGEMMHGNSYRNPAPFAGKRVLVVGAGNTGAEIAAELGNAGIDCSIAIRSGTTFVPHPTSATAVKMGAWFFPRLPTRLASRLLAKSRPSFTHLGIQPPAKPLVEAYPVVGFALPDAITAGKVRLFPTPQRFSGETLHFADGQSAPFDTVIWATGYRPAVHFIDPTPELDMHGQLSAAYAQANPALYPLGYDYPATSGWLQTIGRRAERLTAEIMRLG